MTITALTQDNTELYQQTYYSIGGGFIVDEEHFEHAMHTEISVPFPYQNAADMLKHCDDNGLPLSSVVMKMKSHYMENRIKPTFTTGLANHESLYPTRYQYRRFITGSIKSTSSRSKLISNVTSE